MTGGIMRKERWTNNVVVNKEFISCEENSMWSVFNGLQKILDPFTVTTNSLINHAGSRIPGPLKDVRHIVRSLPSRFNGFPQLTPCGISLGVNNAL
jgi:hypothetical protein